MWRVRAHDCGGEVYLFFPVKPVPRLSSTFREALLNHFLCQILVVGGDGGGLGGYCDADAYARRLL